MKTSIKIIFSLVIFIFFCEYLTRIFFPIFNEKNLYYKESIFFRVSKGVDAHFKYLDNILIRVADKKVSPNKKYKNTIWFFGDSVTNGYGVSYEDAYYSVFQKKLENVIKYNIFASGQYGNNFKVNNSFIEKIKENLIPGDKIIYQFNYNDLNDLGKNNSLLTDDEIPSRSNLMKIINKTNKFRYRYLNNSSFFQMLQHYASIMVRNTNGTCEERGLDALGPYTYSYFAKGFEEKSKIIWKEFENSIIETKKKLESLNVNYTILIIPISIQLENHDIINKLKYDLECSTQDGRIYLLKLLKKNDIDYIDVFDEFKKSIKKNNNLLYHSFDTNHPNIKGHKIIGKTLYEKIF